MDHILVKLLMVVTCAVASCGYDASFRDCTIRCSPEVGCPAGLTCENEHLCRSPGQTQSCASILADAAPDAPHQFSSCDGLAPTCGRGSNESCCSTATSIPGGMFFRSYDSATDGMYNNPGYPATVAAFALDKYEVTVGRFRRFVTAGMGTQGNPPAMGTGARTLNGLTAQGGWDASWNANLATDTSALTAAVKCDSSHQTWTDTAGDNENLPMNCITWYEAMAFCIWDGGYLPTEAEWNFAATGGSEQRAYPWSVPAGSTAIDCSYANYRINSPSGMYCVNGMTGGTNPVGSESPKGDGKWGQSDLAGNVFEWTLDWYASPYSNPCTDCADLAPGTDRVTRGASFNIISYVRASYRAYTPPTSRFPDLGVRCAREP